MHFFLRTICTFLVTLALLTACGVTVIISPEAGAPTLVPMPTALVSPTLEATAPPTPTAILPTPTTEVGAALPDGMLLRYNRHGCYAGIDEELIISTDGTASFTATDGEVTTRTLTPEQQQTLAQLVGTPAFRTLEQPQLPFGADFCYYRITTNTDTHMSRTLTSVGRETDPAPLREIVRALEHIRVQFPAQCNGMCR